MSDPWYESFFEGVVVDMWRSATPEEATRAEVDFLIRELGLEPGQRVLDVPCGHGRHSIELAARSLRVAGVDLSADMLAVARRRATSRGVDVEWLEGDMRRLPGGSPFDGAFCFGNSFGYLGPRGNREFVEAVASRLVGQGRLAIHTGMVAECVLPRLEERGWAPLGDMLFLEENRYDAAESCLETEYTFVRDGEVVSRVARHWVYTIRELRELLASAGLVTCGLFADTAGRPFELGAEALLLVAEKT